jgi:hypothetical protein
MCQTQQNAKLLQLSLVPPALVQGLLAPRQSTSPKAPQQAAQALVRFPAELVAQKLRFLT